MKSTIDLSILIVLALSSGLACAKKSKSSAPPPPAVSAAPAESNGITLTAVSRIAQLLEGGDPMVKFRDHPVSEDELRRYVVHFEYPQALSENARLTRTIGRQTKEIQLAQVHAAGTNRLSGHDTIDLEAGGSLAPVTVHYRWENGAQAQDFKVVLKRSWIVGGAVDFRKLSLPENAVSGELNLEYLFLRSTGKIVIGSRSFKLRARYIGAEAESRIVSFTEEYPRQNDESASSGLVQLRTDASGGQLIAELNGANGRKGATAPDRSATEKGSDGVAGHDLGRCIIVPTVPAGRGPDGLTGFPGENGGDGGSMVLLTPENAPAMSVFFKAEPGRGGDGGQGGKGGPGGKGTDLTLARDCAVVIHPTPQGDWGITGHEGQRGADSKIGGKFQKLAPIGEGA